jgi:hypothetical protein
MSMPQQANGSPKTSLAPRFLFHSSALTSILLLNYTMPVAMANMGALAIYGRRAAFSCHRPHSSSERLRTDRWATP